MSREIFVLACQLAEKMNIFIDIGGGEPTLHPFLWDFIGIALKYKGDSIVCMATNGKITEDALALARIARLKVLRVDLSLDKYHELIDYKVVKAFEKLSGPVWNYSDYRGIRDITLGGSQDPAPFGRAKDWADPEDIRCPGNDLAIAPDGTIHACGCRVVTYGTIYEPRLPYPIPEQWCSGKLGWSAKEVVAERR